jgi:hypothetical protein
VGAVSLASTRIQFPDRPACTELLYYVIMGHRRLLVDSDILFELYAGMFSDV